MYILCSITNEMGEKKYLLLQVALHDKLMSRKYSVVLNTLRLGGLMSLCFDEYTPRAALFS